MVDTPLEYLRGIHWVTSVFSLHPSRRCPAWSQTWARARGRPRPSWGRWWGWPGCSGWRSSACPPTAPSPAGSTGQASSGCRLSLHSALETLGTGLGVTSPCWYDSDIRFWPELEPIPRPEPWIWCWEPMLPPWLPILFMPCSLQHPASTRCSKARGQ